MTLPAGSFYDPGKLGDLSLDPYGIYGGTNTTASPMAAPNPSQQPAVPSGVTRPAPPPAITPFDTGNLMPDKATQDAELAGYSADEKKNRGLQDTARAGIDAQLKERNDANQAHLGEMQQREAEMEQLRQQMPKDNMTFVMKQSPLFMGLALLGGSMFRTGALTALGEMNGMVHGMMAGDQQAYQEAWKKYELTSNQLFAKFKMRDDLYAAEAKKFGDSLEGQKMAWDIANSAIQMDKRESDSIFNQRFEVQKMMQTAKQHQEQMATTLEAARISASWHETVANTRADAQTRAKAMEIAAKYGPTLGGRATNDLKAEFQTLRGVVSALDAEVSANLGRPLSPEKQTMYEQDLGRMQAITQEMQQRGASSASGSSSPTFGSAGAPAGGGGTHGTDTRFPNQTVYSRGDNGPDGNPVVYVVKDANSTPFPGQPAANEGQITTYAAAVEWAKAHGVSVPDEPSGPPTIDEDTKKFFANKDVLSNMAD